MFTSAAQQWLLWKVAIGALDPLWALFISTGTHLHLKVKMHACINKQSPQGIKWANSYACQWSFCRHASKYKY